MIVPEIDGYSDIEQVARGGFGIVYRARREALDQYVALKVLALADLSERDRERFQREARAAGNLSWHPNVVAVYDSGITTDGHPYLAMEYLDAGTFADRLIADGPLPWSDVVVAGIQVAGALAAAHTAGTLHRDLKPENILISPFDEAKLGDFGIAAVEGGTRTATGHASYTVTHVAPEILRGQRPDERSDLYGLASTLFTLLTGRTPFAGDDPDEPIATIITRALTEPAPHLTGIPEPLADLLEQTLDKDPDHRPQTAAEFGKALQKVQQDNDQPVTTLRLAPRTAAPANKPSADTQGDNRRTIHVGPTTPPPPDPVEPERVDPGPADPNATITVGPPPQTSPDQQDTSPPPPPPETDQAPPPPPPDERAQPVAPSRADGLLDRTLRGGSLVGAALGLGGIALLLLSLPLPWDFGNFVYYGWDGYMPGFTSGGEKAQILSFVGVTAVLALVGTLAKVPLLRAIAVALLGVMSFALLADEVDSQNSTLLSGFLVAAIGTVAMLAGAVIDIRFAVKKRSTR